MSLNKNHEALNSNALRQAFERNVDPDIEAKLSALEWLIDPSLFPQFWKRVKEILAQNKWNPWVKAIVSNELDKTMLKVELQQWIYSDKLANILEDPNRVTRRPYWWSWTPQSLNYTASNDNNDEQELSA